MVSFGATSGLPPAVEVGVLNAKGSLFLTRPSLAAHTATIEEYQSRAQDVLDAIAAGILTPRIWKSYALKDAALAHADLEQGRSQGSIILTPESLQTPWRYSTASTRMSSPRWSHWQTRVRLPLRDGCSARHPSVLSKRMQALERRLGVRLVERTTRQLHFTNEGWRLVGSCARLPI
jgi:hypothetical protein